MKRFLGAAFAALMLSCVPALAQVNQSIQGGGKVASAYGLWRGNIVTGNTATGAQTITVSPALIALPDGRVIQPWSVTAPIAVDLSSGTQTETVTPTAVSCNQSGGTAIGGTCSITATFNNTHGAGIYNVQSGTFGLQEAINDAFAGNGSPVIVDSTWQGGHAPLNSFTGPSGTSVSTVPYPSVSIIDTRFGTVQYWNTNQSTATVINAPATLTATTVGFGLNGANTTGGTYTGASTYHVAVACMDLMGNESQPSADFSGLTAGTGTANQIGIAAPAQPTGGGCVAWVPYISLGGGTYALAYRVPVATFSAGVPTANGVCALNQALAQVGIAGCQITNTTYGTTGSNAIVSALTVNTARIWVGLGGASTTADVVGNTNARQSYQYTPGTRLAVPGITNASLAFGANTGPATAVPGVVATIQLPANFMNYVGKKIKVCGNLTSQGGSTATIDQIEFYWDADGSNATGAGVILPAAKITNTLSATPALRFCQNLVTTVAGTGATAGTILVEEGDLGETMSVAATTAANFFTVPNIVVAGSTVAALNLAGEARLDIAVLHTTGTDGTWTANGITVTPLN